MDPLERAESLGQGLEIVSSGVVPACIAAPVAIEQFGKLTL